ncbi:MAG: ABC transporter ATP-binding protein [Candidatus Kariarchaeaceae archaeon]
MASPVRQASEFKPRREYNTNRSSALKWILSHMKMHKFFLLVVILFTIGASLTQAIIPGLIGDIFEEYDKGNLTTSYLTKQSIIILVLGVGAGIITLLRNFSTEFVSQRLERDTRDELYSSLIGKSLSFHDKQRIGDLMTRAATDVRQLNFMINPGFNLVFASIMGTIIPLVFIGMINPQLLIIPIVYMIIFIIVLKWYNAQLTPWAHRSRIAASRISARLNEVLGGMHVVRGAAQEEKERKIFDNNIESYKETRVKIGEIQAKYYPTIILGVATAMAIYHSIVLYNDGIINLGEVISFILLLQLLRLPTFLNIFAITVLTMGIASANRILELMKGESLIDDNPDGYSEKIKGEIEFKDMTFGYSEDLPVLQNIGFSVKPGQTVALVGMTGSGKSTITKLLARLYLPQSGSITIDGVDINDWSINSLRGQMAVVEQDVFLFSKSIADNIKLGLENVTEEAIIEAAKLAQIDNFIQSLNDGYDTEIGERGTRLSGGQKQRVAIARAIIRNPSILILDDASSAIDSQTEDEINKAIRDVLKNRVSFLITHRIAQISKADLIILLDQGKIIDQGTHDYLLKNSPKYLEIFSTLDSGVGGN